MTRKELDQLGQLDSVPCSQERLLSSNKIEEIQKQMIFKSQIIEPQRLTDGTLISWGKWLNEFKKDLRVCTHEIISRVPEK